MEDYDKLSREDLIRALMDRDSQDLGGIRMSYPGQRPPWQIVRQVQPRSQRIERKLCHGTEAEQCENLVIEGENLQAMVSLYKYRGQVDLIVTDPPFNTGKDFRYNDRWDEDPNDPDLGKLVPTDDGSRHSKWLRFMVPRIWVMREMLKPTGVLAICIDHRELFRLGMLLDEIFGESNRLAIINWQKTTSKNDAKHVSNTTEYVLVYAKNEERVKTGLLERTHKTNKRFNNADNDPDGDWQWGDLTAATQSASTVFSIQSPFTGELFDPGRRAWANRKSQIKEWLELWGTPYQEVDLGDGMAKALVLKGWSPKGSEDRRREIVRTASAKAHARLAQNNWPVLYFGQDGLGRPAKKHHIKKLKAGAVPITFWVDAEEPPIEIGSTSWTASESGRSREGVEELQAVLGKSAAFETVKPLKLIRKIIQIWCPKSGIALDPFAGTGTTGHAILQLNAETGAERRFILIEQGRPERGDAYARTLTAERLKRALAGEVVDDAGEIVAGASPLPGGFRFSKLMSKVDAAAVLALEREEMIDLLLTSHWDRGERGASHLQRLPAGSHQHLFARSGRGEGYFLVWNGPDKPSVLNREAFRAIAKEAQEEGLTQPFHVYARISTYSGPNTEFYQIPNRILEKLGFNEAFSQYGTAVEAQQAREDAA
ncbi:site-specific DNA-methyltransferase [Methylorubrum sp. SB2]|uniref:site-specific DNA-methyltransferase n=1 Tax=Methylorubrum subtropicum TaxID=3138812 RepID=UPI00313C0CB9